uniref:Aquaporin n=1 Tax=Onchocerca volvulus TaxID=6282 RepID=A0A8R1XSC6_ONCVO
MTDCVSAVRNKLRIRNDLLRCALAEFICTAFFIFAGTSTNAANLLSDGNCKICVIFGWTFAIGIAALAAGHLSGGHLNPAVSFAFYICGQISVYRFITYSIAQTAGAFLGSLTTFILYYDGINHFDGGERQTLGPKASIGIFFLGSAFLAFSIMMFSNPRNKIPAIAKPVILGITIFLISVCVSANAGGEVNPARDIGPKITALIAGYDWTIFSYRDYKWFSIPILIPFAGAAFGAWFYHLTLGIHVSEEKDNRKIHDRMQMNEVSRVTIGNSGISIK